MLVPIYPRLISSTIVLAGIVAGSAAIACAPEVSAEDAARAADLNRKGLLEFRQGNLPGALKNFQTAAAADPREGEYPNNGGMALLQSAQAAQALELFETAADRNPTSALYLYNQALALVRLNQDDRAIAALDEAIAIDPEYFDAFAYAGLVHFKNAEFERSAKAWQQATALRENAELESNLGLAYMNLGEAKLAGKHIRRAIELEPASATAQYNAGVYYQRQENFAAAERSYLTAIAIQPGKVEAYMNAAIVQTQLNNQFGAVKNLQEFIERAPAGMAKQVQDAKLRLADLRR